MSWIDEHWLQMGADALRATLGNDPHLKKAMIQFLLDEGFWDSESLKTWEAAVARFDACLNPNKAQFFKLGEVWALMKRFGRYQLFEAMADDLGFDVRLRPTEERRQALLERIAEAYEACDRSVGGAHAELRRLVETPAPPGTRVAPLDGGKRHFSVALDGEVDDRPPSPREGMF